MPKKNQKRDKIQISIPNCTLELKAWLEQDAEKYGRSLAAHIRRILEDHKAFTTRLIKPD